MLITGKQNVSLPENLKRQFALLEQRLWKVETLRTLSCAAIALSVSYLVLFLSDRFWDTPHWFRCCVFLAGLTVTIFAAIRWTKVWVLKRRDWRDLSALVQRRFRKLGDRLLGIVELSGEKEHSPNYSRELYEAAIRQVADEADKYNFVEAVEIRTVKRLGGIAISLLAVLLALAAVIPEASWNALQRWGVPLASIERYTLVQITDLPEKIVAPHGEVFRVDATVRYRSFWHPKRASARFSKTTVSEASVTNELANFQIPGQTQNGVLKIKVGDAERTVKIEPSYRPSLTTMDYTIHLPDYLKYPPVEERVRGSSVTLLENSHISFRGTTTRKLSSAEANDGQKIAALEVASNSFSSAFFNGDLATSLTFSWRDTVGLTNSSPWRVSLVKEKDRAPIPDMPQLSREISILQTDVLDVRTIARDDFGVRGLGISWEVETSAEEAASWASTEVKISKNSAREKEVQEIFRWSPGIFRIPPDSSVDLVAFATDYFPERERSESSVRRINVLGNERHAELVRQNLESVLARVEEVSRKQEQVMAKTEDLQNAENLTPKTAEEKIGKLANEQTQNARQLNQLSTEGMQALREALKNPVFTPKALQEWSKTLQQMQELSQGKMNEAGKDLKEAQAKSGDPSAREQQLGQAQKKIDEILKELEELQGKVNKGLDDLQALTLSERLRKLGETEEQLGTEMKKIIPETIGLLAKELPDKFKRVETKMSKTQENVHKEAQNLQREVNRFYERTQKQNYGDVGKDMTDTRVTEELDRIRELVENNVGMEASRNFVVWSKRFSDWADKLKPPTEESSSSGQGQGEGQGEGPNMTKTLIALLRLREKEMNLHRQTEMLEEKKSVVQDYNAQAGELRQIQGKIKEGVVEIEQENKLPMLKQLYSDTREAMGEVERFLQLPQTDAVTSQAQVKTVELLTDVINLINEQAKRNPPPAGGSQGQESQDMAFLMQMMSQPGMGQGMPSQQGGGNMSGGSTDQAATGSTADGTGKAGEERKVNKASGTSGVNVPSEFRETLENFFKAMEQEESR